MSFMRATISTKKEVFVIHERPDEYGPEFITETRLPNNLEAGNYSEDISLAEIVEAGLELEELEAIQDYLKENDIDEFTVTEPLYWGQLSASGYMDQTSKALGESLAEVAQQLLDLYFDSEYLDADELEDRTWLEKIAAGEDPGEVE
jgi:hypothetical protein